MRWGGGGRGGTFVQPGYEPIRCGRFGVKNARVVKKVGEKETPLGEKETPLGEKVTKIGEKVNFVGGKKIHADWLAYTLRKGVGKRERSERERLGLRRTGRDAAQGISSRLCTQCSAPFIDSRDRP